MSEIVEGYEAISGVEIRHALPTEAGALAELWLRSRAASVPSIPQTVHSDVDVHTWFEEVVLPTYEVWIADDRARAVGLLVLNNEWVDQLYVDPTLTGRGIGGALLERAKMQRPNGLKLWTFQSNVDAQRFYESRGFVATAQTAGDNEERARDLCYEWRPDGASRVSSGGGDP